MKVAILPDRTQFSSPLTLAPQDFPEDRRRHNAKKKTISLAYRKTEQEIRRRNLKCLRNQREASRSCSSIFVSRYGIVGIVNKCD